MPFSKRQIQRIQSLRRSILDLRDEDTWRLFLRNCHVLNRDAKNNPRISDSRNTQAAYEELMWRMYELIEQARGGHEHDVEYWFSRVIDRGDRLRRAIEAYAAECERRGILEPGGLGGFVWRMTADLQEERTREIIDLDLPELLKIVRGLVPWMTRKAAECGVSAPRFGQSALDVHHEAEHGDAAA